MPRLKLLIFTVLCLGAGVFANTNAQTVQMRIEGIRNSKGNIQLGIFTNQEQFRKEEPVIEKVFSKRNMRAGVLVVRFELEHGNYGIAVLDDENKDGDMNYNFIGVPREGFGFSNFVSSGMTKPRYSDFSFDVKPGLNKVEVKMRYIL